MSTDGIQTAPSYSAPQQAAWAHLLGIPPAPATKPAEVDRRPRRLTTAACQIDSLLSHAIEYLTDARQLPSGKVTALPPEEPDVQAILILMEARHQNYLACPIIERRTRTGLLGVFSGIDRRKRTK